WPPSKPGPFPPPEREFWPFWPRPAVFTEPPWPRPTRLRRCRAPAGDLISLAFMAFLQVRGLLGGDRGRRDAGGLGEDVGGLLAHQLLHGLAAAAADDVGAHDLGQALDRRVDDVDGVVRAQRLGEDV